MSSDINGGYELLTVLLVFRLFFFLPRSNEIFINHMFDLYIGDEPFVDVGNVEWT